MNALRSLQVVGALLALTVSLAAQSNPPLAQPVPGLVAATTTNPTDIVVQAVPTDIVLPPFPEARVAPPVVPPTAATPLTTVTVGVPRQITVSVTLGDSNDIYYVMAPPPPTPINVDPGSTLKLSVPAADAASAIVWYRSGTILGVTTPTLELTNVTAADSGLYAALVTPQGGTTKSLDYVPIRVETQRRQRLMNLSTRATISAASPLFIGGFVVDGSPGKLNESKIVLVRAVGPSLAKLGVANPLASPKLQLFRGDGTAVDLTHAVTTKDSASVILAQASAGAFSLLPDAKDVVILIPLPAGAYTAHVSSADGGSGDVMLEFYEVPDNSLLPFL